MNTLTSRKFLITLLALLCATGLAWLGKIDSTSYAAIVVGTVGAYITGNVVQKKVASNGGS